MCNVSILMPLYNAEKWVVETIHSVLAQTYPNWELIVVDDGSTDQSVAIVNEFVQKDARIKLIQQENKGACVARNKAFEWSKGEYIQYLDADDLLSPDKIEKQIEAIRQTKDETAIANCPWEKFQKTIGDMQFNRTLIQQHYSRPIDSFIDDWINGGHGQTNCWLTPRSIVQKVGKWDENLTANQDGEFFCRVLLNASQICFVKEIRVYYRKDNSSSISQSKPTFKKAASQLRSYHLYQEHLSTFIKEERVQTALAANYLKFVNQYHSLYPQLVQEAKTYIKALPLANKKAIIKRWFHPLASIFGFDFYLKLKRIIN